VAVQCYRCDESKPYQHRYSKPAPEDPWHKAYNIYARRKGTERPDELIVLVSHKVSQSWIAEGCPGASDNAVGTVANIEIARVLADYAPRRSIWHLWCNEEHTPWTSVEAARRLAESDCRAILIINLDGLGRSRAEDREAGRHTTRVVYTTPEGERIADRMGELNDACGIGLEFGKAKQDQPRNDDGSFIKAGMPHAVHHIGCHPYNVPDYHTKNDKPDLIDIENVVRGTQLTLAAVLDADCSPARP